MTHWLTLQEYSIEKGLSISTLRRKIKNNELEYKLENGRYLLKSLSERDSSLSYEEELKQIKENLKNLKNNNKDLLHLVYLLEADKAELLKQNAELLKCLENVQSPI